MDGDSSLGSIDDSSTGDNMVDSIDGDNSTSDNTVDSIDGNMDDHNHRSSNAPVQQNFC